MYLKFPLEWNKKYPDVALALCPTLWTRVSLGSTTVS